MMSQELHRKPVSEYTFKIEGEKMELSDLEDNAGKELTKIGENKI